jgi:hypothetical protein
MVASVFEVTGRTGMTVAHSSVTSATASGSDLGGMTSNPLSAAATTGRLVMSFVGAGVGGAGAMSPETGWNQIGVVDAGGPVSSSAYWRKNFTGTTFTVTDLGNEAGMAGMILVEFN